MNKVEAEILRDLCNVVILKGVMEMRWYKAPNDVLWCTPGALWELKVFCDGGDYDYIDSYREHSGSEWVDAPSLFVQYPLPEHLKDDWENLVKEEWHRP